MLKMCTYMNSKTRDKNIVKSVPRQLSRQSTRSSACEKISNTVRRVYHLSEAREFHEEAALNANAFWVQVSLHLGRSSAPSHAARVSLEDTSVRLVNMALTAGGHGRAPRAFLTILRSCRRTNSSTRSHPSESSAGEIWSDRLVPVTSLAAKLIVFWIRRV